jgi:hypothetical protein
MDWTVVKAVMNPGVPQNAGNFLISLGPVSFSRRTLLHGGFFSLTKLEVFFMLNALER